MSLGDYEEVEYLGCGGFGSVSLVRSRKGGQQYALKKINTKHLSQTYRREATVLCQLNHCNILALKTYFEVGDIFCLVTEYCPRGDLAKEIKRRSQRFTESEVMNLTIQLCHALQYVHEQNIIHRDLKPDNIFLTDNDVIKIGDFGLARELQPHEWALSPVGTRLYMSPEIVDRKSHNNKADIYSLGCCLYELMTLQTYLNGDELIRHGRRIYGKMPSSGYCSELTSLVSQMLSANHADRPSASEILKSPAVRNYANMHYVSFSIFISSKRKLFVLRRDSTVKDLYDEVAKYTGDNEGNFELKLNGLVLDKAKRLSDYTFDNDPQSGIYGQNLTNVVYVRQQHGG